MHSIIAGASSVYSGEVSMLGLYHRRHFRLSCPAPHVAGCTSAVLPSTTCCRLHFTCSAQHHRLHSRLFCPAPQVALQAVLPSTTGCTSAVLPSSRGCTSGCSAQHHRRHFRLSCPAPQVALQAVLPSTTLIDGVQRWHFSISVKRRFLLFFVR